jgi:hypothetical protein
VSYLVKVDDWLPEVVLLFVEISHSDLSEVTWMVLIHVGSVVVLTTSKTTTTGMLAVLSYTTVSSGDVAAAVKRDILAIVFLQVPKHQHHQSSTTRHRQLSHLRRESRDIGENVLLAGLGQTGRHFGGL